MGIIIMDQLWNCQQALEYLGKILPPVLQPYESTMLQPLDLCSHGFQPSTWHPLKTVPLDVSEVNWRT